MVNVLPARYSRRFTAPQAEHTCFASGSRSNTRIVCVCD
jgi:hypothetical protein